MCNTLVAQEHRKYPRRPFFCEAKLLVQGSAPWVLKTLDISEGGIGGVVEKSFPTGDNCVIALDVVMGAKSRRINVWGAIVYREPHPGGLRVGLQYRDFDTMSRFFLLQLAG